MTTRITRRAFDAAVEAAVERRRALDTPQTVRTIVVDFDRRAVTIDGHTIVATHVDTLAAPVLHDDRIVVVVVDR